MDQFEPYVLRDTGIESRVEADIRAGNTPLAMDDSLKRIRADWDSLQELADRDAALKKMARDQLFFACDELGQLYEYQRDYVHALMYYSAPWFYSKTGQLPSDFSVNSSQTLRLINRKPPFSAARHEPLIPGTHIPVCTSNAAICYYHLGNYGMACLAAARFEPLSRALALYKQLNDANVWNVAPEQAKKASNADRYYVQALIFYGGSDSIGNNLIARRLKAALRIEPGNPKIWKLLGDAYNYGFSLRQATVQNKLSAIEDYRQAARLDPNNAEYWDAIGGTYERIDQMQQPDFNAPSSIYLAMIQYAREAIAAYKVSLGIQVNYDIPHSIAALRSEIKSWQQTYNLLQHEKLEDDLVKQEQSTPHK
jgi:tetratricopeptide (TPR) repeat protein